MKFLLAFGILCFVSVGYCSIQSVSVHGWIRCHDKYLGGVPIELVDKDTIDPDDLMTETTTSNGGRTGPVGYFNVSGSTSEVTKIDPEIRVYHNCTVGDKKPICSRVIIPQSYITHGSTEPKSAYNAEVITLEDKQDDC